MGDDFDLDHLVGMFEQITEKDIIALEAKASQHNIPEEVLEMVFIRGLYEGDKDKAFNRVNSFIALGEAKKVDADLEQDSKPSDRLEGSDSLAKVYKKETPGQTVKEEVWDEPNPKKKHSVMSPAQKASAKARAKAAGRPYPNLVDNMAAMKEEEQIDELKSTTLTSYIDKVATGPSRGKTQTGLLKSIKAISGVTKAIRKRSENNMKEDAPFDPVAHQKEADRLKVKHMNAHAETTRLIKAKASQEEINKAQERNNAIKDEIRTHKDKAPKGPAPKPGSAAHYYASKKPGEYTGD
jgi:hypothetical protein